MVEVYDMTPCITEPEFCPRETCIYYNREKAKNTKWYIRFGTHYSKCRGTIQRFRCKHCGKTFSTQTYSIHYWTHSTIDFYEFAQLLYSCSGLLQTARFKGYTYRVVQNRIRRLARNCLALMNDFYLEHTLTENLVMDGFESYTRSKYFPNNITMLVGKRSQFIYAAVHTMFRRKGKMTAEQHKFRDLIDQYWVPKGKIKDDVRAILLDCLSMMCKTMDKRPLTLFTDEHKAYPGAFLSVPALKKALKENKFFHSTTSSTAPRTRLNPLFSANYVDRQMRKNMGEHVRKTVKQGREVNCQMERMAIFMAMHNFFTPHRIHHVAEPENEPTHREEGGVFSSMFHWYFGRLFTHRHIFGHLRKPAEWIRRVWRFQYENPPGFNFAKMKLSDKVMALPPGHLARHFLV